MNIQDVLMWIISPVLMSVVGGFAGWFFTRKSQSITNIDLAADTWQGIVTKLKGEIPDLINQIKELSAGREEDGKKIEALTNEVSELRSQVTDMQSQIIEKKNLEKKLMRYEKLLADNNIPH